MLIHFSLSVSLRFLMRDFCFEVNQPISAEFLMEFFRKPAKHFKRYRCFKISAGVFLAFLRLPLKLPLTDEKPKKRIKRKNKLKNKNKQKNAIKTGITLKLEKILA